MGRIVVGTVTYSVACMGKELKLLAQGSDNLYLRD